MWTDFFNRKIYWFFYSGYINESGKLNLKRFEVFMARLGLADLELFREHYSDIRMMDTKYVSIYSNFGSINTKKNWAYSRVQINSFWVALDYIKSSIRASIKLFLDQKKITIVLLYIKKQGVQFLLLKEEVPERSKAPPEKFAFSRIKIARWPQIPEISVVLEIHNNSIFQNNDETFGADVDTLLSTDTKSDLADLIKSTMLDFGTSSDENSDDENSNPDICDDDDSEEDTFEKEFLVHKRNYYINKLKYPEMTE